MPNQASSYDLIIVGGSMVGAALACALGGSRLRVAVVEASEAPSAVGTGDYDLRVSAITRASQRIFESVGAWDAMAALRVSPFRHMHVWDAGGSGVIHFDSAEVGEATLGHIIENRVVQESLLARLRDFDNVTVLRPAALDVFTVGSDGVTVRLRDGSELDARLLVGADGARSSVRAQAGIAVRGWAYDQTAVVATVRTQRSHEETAWQRFLPNGPLAFLPLGDGSCSIVWTTTPEEAEALLGLGDDEFLRRLSDAFDQRLGPVIATGPRAAFPLRLRHAAQYVQPRLALIGDAAHTIHPLAGQGVNLGLLDAATLAEVLLDAAARRRDLGDLAVLRRFERWRKGDNLAMMAAMEGFKRAFGSGLAPVRLLRNAGLGLVNGAGPLKRVFIRHAMGLGGDLPRLARPAVGWQDAVR